MSEEKKERDSDLSSDDDDFVPDEKQSSDEGSAVGDEEGERPAKRRRTSKAAAKEAEANKAYASVDIDALWADMKASSTPSLKPTSSASSASTPTSTPQTAQPDTPKTIQPTKSAVFITSLNEFLSRSKSLGDLMASSKPEPVKKTVTETYKFAGEIINVTKEIDESVPQKRVAPKKAQSAGSLGKLLSNLNGPKKMSTIQKSSMDWDKFKKEQKIEDELTLQTKDGFLEKQAFLQRADERQFEVEKGLRDKKRALQSKK